MTQAQARTSPPFTHKARLSRTTLYPEDCFAGMRQHLQPQSVDVVVTSPPYNLGIAYSHYDDTMTRPDYVHWLGEWAGIVKSILSESGSVFLNIGSKPSDPAVPFQVLAEMQKHFTLQNVIHWIKSIAIEKREVGNYPGITQDIAVGHFKPINSPRYINDCHEYIFHLTQHGTVPLDRLAVGVAYQDKSNVARWSGGRDKRCRGNTWFVPYKTIKSRAGQRPHPATFPVKIPEMCIRLHGLERIRLVLDPFLGIGHSALAAQTLGVNFVGFEIDRDYFDTACHLVRPTDKPNEPHTSG